MAALPHYTCLLALRLLLSVVQMLNSTSPPSRFFFTEKSGTMKLHLPPLSLPFWGSLHIWVPQVCLPLLPLFISLLSSERERKGRGEERPVLVYPFYVSLHSCHGKLLRNTHDTSASALTHGNSVLPLALLVPWTEQYIFNLSQL